MTKAKILYLDIETLPNISYIFNIFEGSKPNMIIKEKSIVTFAYKWAHEKGVKVLTNTAFQGNKKDPYDDKGLTAEIVKLLNEADYVVAHYGDKFDIRYIRARALINGLPTVGPLKTIDTYKLAKKYFHLNANRLDYLGKLLGFGGKIGTSWSLWEDCAKGDPKALAKMALYNKRDVELLEKVFLKMLPYVDSPINQRLFGAKLGECPVCKSTELQKRGTIVNKLTKRQRIYCKECGSWHSERIDK